MPFKHHHSCFLYFTNKLEKLQILMRGVTQSLHETEASIFPTDQIFPLFILPVNIMSKIRFLYIYIKKINKQCLDHLCVHAGNCCNFILQHQFPPSLCCSFFNLQGATKCVISEITAVYFLAAW